MISPSLWHSIRIKPDVRNWLQYVRSGQNDRKRVSDICYFLLIFKIVNRQLEDCFPFQVFIRTLLFFFKSIIFNVICVIIKTFQNCSIVWNFQYGLFSKFSTTKLGMTLQTKSAFDDNITTNIRPQNLNLPLVLTFIYSRKAEL